MWRANARKVVVLFSGGVESTCLLYYYLMQGWLTYPLYVKAGYPWERLELEKAKRLWLFVKDTYRGLMPMRVSTLVNPERPEKRGHERELYIPIRNLSLVTTASLYAIRKGIECIALGSLGMYPFPDNNAEYMQSLEKLAGLKVFAPFMGMHKREVIEKFLGVVPFERTLSCINPKRRGRRIEVCGRCPKCEERREAFSPGLNQIT
ncbi:MAG: 7-cyano-7-deazaguanine synthase [Aquificaceae bacterium]|nr:7-cyano-7-deazaguanine synthase [Aquificaceae bacterium]MDW8294787.1 7-cyano-7-deazaguanine synthase [Aquificaceae bacterium]